MAEIFFDHYKLFHFSVFQLLWFALSYKCFCWSNYFMPTTPASSAHNASSQVGVLLYSIDRRSTTFHFCFWTTMYRLHSSPVSTSPIRQRSKRDPFLPLEYDEWTAHCSPWMPPEGNTNHNITIILRWQKGVAIELQTWFMKCFWNVFFLWMWLNFWHRDMFQEHFLSYLFGYS